jgi:hypothetical protein
MFERTKRKWKGTVQPLDAGGKSVEVTVETYWASDGERIKESIGEALCAKAFLASKRKVRFIAIGEPELVTS